MGVLAIVLVMFGAFYMFKEKEQKGLKMEISKLEAELTILKEYNKGEQELIDREIMTFRKNYADHRNKNETANRARGDLDKFLIPAEEVEPVKMIGKGR